MAGLRLLDLFCGAGGAAMGYSRAGFTDIVGVDIKPQPHYPFTFIQADALEYLAEHGQEFDAIHASPPCQGYSIMNNLPWLKGRSYPLLILPVREMLEAIGLPYVLENVVGARYGAKGLTKRGLEAHGLQAGWLCGTMFGLPFYRHRLFAGNWFWLAPGHPKHRIRTIPSPPDGGGTMNHGRPRDPFHDKDGKSIIGPGNLGKGNGAQAAGVGVGHAKGWRLAAEAMGIDWMNRAELTQAIPPAYTEFIGKALLANLQGTLRGVRGPSGRCGRRRPRIARRATLGAL